MGPDTGLRLGGTAGLAWTQPALPAYCRHHGLEAGVQLPSHPGGAGGHCGAVSPQAAGASGW